MKIHKEGPPRRTDYALDAQTRFADALRAREAGMHAHFKDGMMQAGALFFKAFFATHPSYEVTRELHASGAVTSFFESGNMSVTHAAARLVLSVMDHGRMDPANLANIRSMEQRARQALTP